MHTTLYKNYPTYYFILAQKEYFVSFIKFILIKF